MKHRNFRFTLIELLLVIAVIAILAGMLLPALGNAKKIAKTAQCTSNMRQFSLYIMSYVSDFNSYLPGGKGFQANEGGTSEQQYWTDWLRIPEQSYRDLRCPAEQYILKMTNGQPFNDNIQLSQHYICNGIGADRTYAPYKAKAPMGRAWRGMLTYEKPRKPAKTFLMTDHNVLNWSYLIYAQGYYGQIMLSVFGPDTTLTKFRHHGVSTNLLFLDGHSVNAKLQPNGFGRDLIETSSVQNNWTQQGWK